MIACIGAGLRAFTRYARVEYANGTEVPAEGFLAEVEGAVLDGLLEKLFGVSQAGVAQVDVATRFYILWRYAYHQAAVEAGEAIVFAYPLRVELDGPGSLSGGHNPLVIKNKTLYRLRDFTERGEHPELGRQDLINPVPLIDALQRILWLVENHPGELQAYLDEVRPDLERLRAVAQALAGPALGESGGAKSSAGETAALRKLTANWRSLVEENLFSPS